MNLTRALDVALPDIPARTLAERVPRLDPGTTFREHIEDGEPVVRIYVPCVGGMFKLPPSNWKLAQLFDGKRTYEEIAELYSEQTGTQYDVAEIREFAAMLEAGQFWYKTPQEKNILLMQQTTEERRKKLSTRSKWADLSMVVFPAFNPDRFLTWLYGYTSWMYTPWFTVLTLIAFGFTTGITITHWSEIGHDTAQFYNFSDKTWGDVAYLYVIGMIVVAVHEFAHAHACKHYGGRVPAMGFALVYLTPAFYTDTTEGTVMGSRHQRLIIALAGVWSELMLCAIATPIWWGTPPDTWLHDGAYFMMMLTGIMSLVVNWNPLMKLDGYHMLCEAIGIPDLKEDSTAYVSAWNKKYIWGLPVEVPYVPKSRRFGFVVYALLSGIYSYMVLYLVAGFVGNVFRNFNPDWSFVPELAVALLIFRSRIRLLVNFMKFVYLDKKDRVIAWFTPQRRLLVSLGAVAFLLLPVWHESASGRFMLEAAQTAEVRPHVPGVVEQILVVEGQPVHKGEVLAKLRSMPLESELDRARTKLVLASERANAANLHYQNLGEALQHKNEMEASNRQMTEKMAELDIVSPISGTVVSPRLQDSVGSYIREGSPLVEVADLSKLRARIYISEYELHKIHAGSAARVQVQGLLGKWTAEATAIAPQASEIDPRLLGGVKLKGMKSAQAYLVDITVSDPKGRLRPGMVGLARVYGERRSLAGIGWEGIRNFWLRKVW